MTSQADVVKHWAHAWRSLRAWHAAIPAMRFEFEAYKGRGFVGHACNSSGRIKVRLTGRLHFDLATVLHELAHLAAPNSEHHSLAWRELFATAAAEALGMSVDDFEIDVPFSELDRQVEDAVEGWLVRSGQTAVLRAIGALP